MQFLGTARSRPKGNFTSSCSGDTRRLPEVRMTRINPLLRTTFLASLLASIVWLPMPASLRGAPSFEAGKFFERMDLDRPELAQIKKRLDAGEPDAALAAWRDLVVERLRNRDFGEFGWHGNSLHPRLGRQADFLAGKTSLEEYLAAPPEEIGFIDIYGLAGAPGQGQQADWMVDVREVTDWGTEALSALPLDQKLTKTAYRNFEDMKSFVARYWRDGDPAYRDKLFEIMADFSVRHHDQFWSDWYRDYFHDEEVKHRYHVDWRLNTNGLETGWRLRNFFRLMAGMVKCLGDDKAEQWDDVLTPRSAPLTREQLDTIDPVSLARIAESALYQHAPKLMWFGREGSVPNQRVTGLVALAYTAAIFPEFKVVPQIEAYLDRQFTDMLEGAFLPDGGSLEQSFNYNEGDLRELEILSRFYSGNPPAFMQRIADVVAARRAVEDGLRTPLGGLPQVGNTSLLSSPRLWESGAIKEAFLKSAQVRGRKEVKPQTFLSKAYPYSGFYAMREGWEPDDLYLFFMNGRPQRGHKMNDNLSVQVMAYQRPLIVTGGPPPYGMFRNDDARGADNYLSEHSSLKVNTVLVDGMSQARNAPPLTRAPQTTVTSRWHTSANFDYVDGRYDLGYVKTASKEPPDMGVAHERSVLFIKPARLWLLTDRMVAADGAPLAGRKFSQVWNFPPRVDDRLGKSVAGFRREEIVWDGEKRRFGTADPGGPNLDFWHAGPRSIDYTLYHGDREHWLGWFAPGIGDAIPAPDMHVNWTADDSELLLTLMAPRNVNDPGPVSEALALDDTETGIAGFDVKLRDGGSLRIRAGAEARELEAGGVSASARQLVVYENGEQLWGVVTGGSRVKLPGGEELVSGADCFSFEKDHAGGWTQTAIEFPAASPVALAGAAPPAVPRAPDLDAGTVLEQGLDWRYAEYPGGARWLDAMLRAVHAPSQADHSFDTATEPFRGRQRFGVVFDGYLKIPRDGVYTFHLSGSPNAALFIHNPERELFGPPLAVSDVRAPRESASIALQAGYHQVRLGLQHHTGQVGEAQVEIEGPDMPRQPLPPDMLFRHTK
jgi:hypothetical protein